MRIYPEVPICTDGAEQIRNISCFNYRLIPPKYRVGSSSFEKITLYKGAMTGMQSSGIPSHAFEHGKIANISKVKKIVELGIESEIENLIDKHTSAEAFSGLLSASLNPELAQVFAPLHKIEGKSFTIYEIKVPANRCLIDASNIGNSGDSREIMVLGYIFPEEISRIKINNDELESELIVRDRFGGLLLRSSAMPTSMNRIVKNPDNWL